MMVGRDGGGDVDDDDDDGSGACGQFLLSCGSRCIRSVLCVTDIPRTQNA